MEKTPNGVVLRIELGLHRPSRAEIQERLEGLARRLRPQAVIAGMRRVEDAIEVAIVADERYRSAQRAGPAAVRQLVPWDEEDGEAIELN